VFVHHAPLTSAARRPSSRPASKPAGTNSAPAITLSDASEAVLSQNVFAGFGRDPVKGLAPAAREPLRGANVVLSADPSTLR
jgi:hypothetical protein